MFSMEGAAYYPCQANKTWLNNFDVTMVRPRAVSIFAILESRVKRGNVCQDLNVLIRLAPCCLLVQYHDLVSEKDTTSLRDRSGCLRRLRHSTPPSRCRIWTRVCCGAGRRKRQCQPARRSMRLSSCVCASFPSSASVDK